MIFDGAHGGRWTASCRAARPAVGGDEDAVPEHHLDRRPVQEDAAGLLGHDSSYQAGGLVRPFRERWRGHRVAEARVVVTADLEHRQALVLRCGVVRADFLDQPALAELVPLVAAQHHARLALEVRPLDDRAARPRVGDHLVDRPVGAALGDGGVPPLTDRARAAERARVHARREVVHAVGLEVGGDPVHVAGVTGGEIVVDPGRHALGREVAAGPPGRLAHRASPGPAAARAAACAAIWPATCVSDFADTGGVGSQASPGSTMNW